jgi:hypothetical protein
MAKLSTAIYFELDNPTNGRIPGHSRGGNGMECRTWIVLIFSFAGAALLYALWIESHMVVLGDDVVFNAALTGIFKFPLLSGVDQSSC